MPDTPLQSRKGSVSESDVLSSLNEEVSGNDELPLQSEKPEDSDGENDVDSQDNTTTSRRSVTPNRSRLFNSTLREEKSADGSFRTEQHNPNPNVNFKKQFTEIAQTVLTLLTQQEKANADEKHSDSNSRIDENQIMTNKKGNSLTIQLPRNRGILTQTQGSGGESTFSLSGGKVSLRDKFHVLVIAYAKTLEKGKNITISNLIPDTPEAKATCQAIFKKAGITASFSDLEEKQEEKEEKRFER